MSEVIKSLLLDKLVSDLSGHVTSARVNINGEEAEYPIFNTVISGLTVRKYVYITEIQAIGETLLGASLLDVDGNLLADQPLNVIKNDKGFLIAFEFVLRLEASASGV